MSCRKMRGLIAASLYEDLSPEERQTLEGHLESCAACRNEAAALGRMASVIAPQPIAALNRDLTPVLRYRLREMKARPAKPFFAWRFAAPFAALAAVLVLIFYVSAPYRQPRAEQPSVAHTAPGQVEAAQIADDPPVQCALAEAEKLVAYHDFANAYRVLKQVVDEYPDAPQAAEAQLRRADIAFSSLKWYPEAYDDYELLADRYPAHFVASQESIRRRDLLAEARERDFAPLHALDAALRSNDGQFAQLEKVVSRYPGTFVASLAAEDMAGLMQDGNVAPAGASAHLAAMESARDRCADLTAKRQLQLEVGHIYQREMDAPDKARECYHLVAENDNAVLARLAKQSLAELGTPQR